MLLPLMQFIFDPSWPSPGGAVFMTPTKVWGPLGVSILLAFLLSNPYLLLVGCLITGVMLWIDPRPHESIDWKEVMDSDG